MTIETNFSATYRVLKLFELSKAVNESIVDELPGIFAIIDTDGRIMRGNSTIAKVIGVSEERVYEHTFSEIFTEQTWVAFKHWLDQLRPGREQVEFQLDLDAGTKAVSYHWNILRTQLAATGRHCFKIMGHDISALQKRGRQLDEIYTTLPLGLVTVGPGGRIESVLTERTDILLGSSDLAGANIVDVLFAQPGARQQDKERKGIQQLVDAFGNDQDFFEVVRSLFPTMVVVPSKSGSKKERFLALSYQPIFKEESLARVLLTLEDRTDAILAQRERDRMKEKDDESVRRILEVKRCPPKLAPLIDKELETFTQKISEIMLKRDPRALLNQLHGLKGNSRLAGLTSLGDQAHHIESELIEAQKKPGFELKAFEARIKLLLAEIAETRRLMSAVLDVKAHDPAKETSDLLAKSMQKLFKKYNVLMSEKRSIGATIAAERVDWAIRNSDLSPLSEVKDVIANQLAAAAREVGKQATLIWTSDSIKIDQETRVALIEILTHLGTNAVSHGIEEPGLRKSLGKPECGTVRVSVRLEGTVLRVLFSDDGRGIDPIAIKLTALKKRLRTSEELNEMKNVDLLQLIFAPGFSTAKEVTQLSGRGVGLDAVSSTIDEMSGKVEVIPNPSGGTDFSSSSSVLARARFENLS